MTSLERGRITGGDHCVWCEGLGDQGCCQINTSVTLGAELSGTIQPLSHFLPVEIPLLLRPPGLGVRVKRIKDGGRRKGIMN